MIIPNFNNIQRLMQYFFVVVIIIYIFYRLLLPTISTFLESILTRLGWSEEQRAKFVSDNRCSPIIIPFIGVLNRNVSTIDNFRQCVNSMFSSFFSVYIKSFSESQSRLANAVNSMSSDIVNIKQIIQNTRNALIDILKDVYNRIFVAFQTIRRLFNQVKRIIVDLISVFKELFSVLIFVYYSMQSMWNGPIGRTARFFCFDENTPINLLNGQTIPISKIKIGDILRTGNRVTAIMKFSSEGQQMYLYNNVIVSGKHLVFDKNKKWTRVENVGTLITYNKPFLYSINTSDNQILINDTLFSDFDECSNPEIRQILMKLILLDESDNVSIEPQGFLYPLNKEASYIMIDGSKIPFLYEYNNIVATGSTFVFVDNKWIQMKDCGKKIKNTSNVLYNTIQKEPLIINETLFKDYQMSNDQNCNKMIDQIIENHLNN